MNKYKAAGDAVAGEYAQERMAIGFTYFSNVVPARQRVQDRILREYITQWRANAIKKKTCCYMMGAPGSGKSYQAAQIADHFVINPDAFKLMIPEYHQFPDHLASGVVHREAAYLAAIAMRWAEQRGLAIIYDSAAANQTWVEQEIARMHSLDYHVTLVYCDTAIETCRAACASRARHVPEFVINRTYSAVTKTFQATHKLFDAARVITR